MTMLNNKATNTWLYYINMSLVFLMLIICCLIISGHRFKPIYDFGYVGLQILYTYPEDNGVYMCKATNKHGCDSTQTELRCQGR